MAWNGNKIEIDFQLDAIGGDLVIEHCDCLCSFYMLNLWRNLAALACESVAPLTALFAS